MLAEVGTGVMGCVYQCPDGVEVLGCNLLHLHLNVAVAWVYIVELAFATLAKVGLYLCVEILVEVEDLCLAANKK